MSVAPGMTMIVERKNPSGCDENITCISDTSCDTSSSSDTIGSVEENGHDDGYIPHIVDLAPVSHLAPHLAPVSPILDSNIILDIVKKNTAALHFLLENYYHAQPILLTDHASGQPVCWTNNNQPTTVTPAVGAVHSSHLIDNKGAMGTNATEILCDLPLDSNFMYDLVNDNDDWVCTTPGENFIDNMDNLFLDDELDIILPNDSDTLMLIEELKSIQ
jgi:hypothetical protein